MIPFNKPLYIGNEPTYVGQIYNSTLEQNFYNKSAELLEDIIGQKNIILTNTCTSALETAAAIIDIKKGDEVIMPSFTFPSTANAFAIRGAKIVFIDIRPETMNINEDLILPAITNKTKAIIPVHYSGVSCDMVKINKIAKKYGVYVIEDAAHSICAYKNNKHLGTFGHFGCISFDETKNINCGKGGALIINDDSFLNAAEIYCNSGTNKIAFSQGKAPFYSWIDKGSSNILSEVQSAFLFAQLEEAENITKIRIDRWNYYYKLLESSNYELPIIPEDHKHNGHIFYIKVKDKSTRNQLIEFLNNNKIQTAFHFIPLHSSEGGKKFGKFLGEDVYTTKESDRLLRLPLFASLSYQDIDYIVSKLMDFNLK